MRPTVRAISMLAVTFIVLMLTGGQAIAVQGRSNQITFCHANSVASKPYVVISTDPASIIKQGHGEHTGPLFDPASGQDQQMWGDVIPAFDYPAFGGTPAGHFGGLNVSAGQSLLDSACTSLAVPRDAELTLVKKVVNAGGGSASPSAWTLGALGSTTLTGVSGVSGAVAAGSYALSEFGGPAGYAGSLWSCPGKVVTADVVTLGAGDSVTCTITNTFQIPNSADVPESENPEETGVDEPIEVLGTGASLAPSVPAVATGAPALAYTGADAIVPIGIFGLIALVLGAGLAATAHRRARD